jgi:hypothetical protein
MIFSTSIRRNTRAHPLRKFLLIAALASALSACSSLIKIGELRWSEMNTLEKGATVVFYSALAISVFDYFGDYDGPNCNDAEVRETYPDRCDEDND